MPKLSRGQGVTSSDVARYVGVSQATVSRAFTPNGSITEATRARIMEAARTLNYVPNSFARSLITRQSDIIAMLIGDLNNSFYTAALGEFSLRLQAIGKQILVFNGATPDGVDTVVRRMLEYQVDGLILTSATISMQVSTLCVERDIPVILFNRTVPGFPGNSVSCDNVAGGKLAAETLIAAGGNRFAVIDGDSRATTSVDRVRGFLARLADQGIGAVPNVRGHYTYEGGFSAATELLNRVDAPDALFCVNDIMALGAIDAARELGRRIPQDLMIIGFDDIREASRPAYRLTTIRQPMRRMVDAAMSSLTARPAASPETRILQGTLIRRGTTP
jgi:DNA-binding LacI/PurR family transcriptional regulator